MAGSRSYSASVLVLRTRKLSESDLILSLLAGDGSLLEAVAKGARKPNNSFATRLDLFCESEVLLARGKNLDIASEVRLVNGHDALRANVAKVYAASPILDCLCQVALPNLPVEHLFEMTASALQHIDSSSEEASPSITAAFLIKLFAILGFRPQLDSCVFCGEERDSQSAGQVYVSFADGGYVCSSCAASAQGVYFENTTLSWASLLLASTFDGVVEQNVPVAASFEVLHFAHRWLRETQNINLKSLNQLFTCGLF